MATTLRKTDRQRLQNSLDRLNAIATNDQSKQRATEGMSDEQLFNLRIYLQTWVTPNVEFAR